MEIVMYGLFLAVGFGLGTVFSVSLYASRIDRLNKAPISVPPPQVQVNVSAELVARYLESFDLVAIPKHLVVSAEETATRH
jgi:hypothetical protein